MIMIIVRLCGCLRMIVTRRVLIIGVLFLFLCVGAVFATEYFTDDFEGSSPWDGTHVEGQGSSYTYGSTAQTHHGSKSWKSNTTDYNGLTYALLREGLGSPSERFFRSYFYLPSLTPDGQSNILHMMFHASSSPTIWAIFGIGASKDGTTPKWRVRDGVNGAWDWIVSPAPVAATWFCVEIYVKVHASEGALKIWINNDDEGSPNWSQTGLDTSGVTLEQIYLGAIASAWQTGHVIYYDCVVVADAFIGTEEEAGGQNLTFGFWESASVSDGSLVGKEKKVVGSDSMGVLSSEIIRKEMLLGFSSVIDVSSVLNVVKDLRLTVFEFFEYVQGLSFLDSDLPFSGVALWYSDPAMVVAIVLCVCFICYIYWRLKT